MLEERPSLLKLEPSNQIQSERRPVSTSSERSVLRWVDWKLGFFIIGGGPGKYDAGFGVSGLKCDSFGRDRAKTKKYSIFNTETMITGEGRGNIF